MLVPGGGSTQRDFNGTIDEVRIFNRSLSAAEILSLYWGSDIITSDETSINDIWSACVTPNDGTQDGATNCSNNITVLAVPNDTPVIWNVTLNSTLGTNLTSENLTGYVGVSDTEGDNITHAYNWYKNGTLNATTLFTDRLLAYYPMDHDVKDYANATDGVCNPCPVRNTTDYKVLLLLMVMIIISISVILVLVKNSVSISGLSHMLLQIGTLS